MMPRGRRTQWGTDPPLSKDDEACRDWLVNTLGNLTLVTKALNSSLSSHRSPGWRPVMPLCAPPLNKPRWPAGPAPGTPSKSSRTPVMSTLTPGPGNKADPVARILAGRVILVRGVAVLGIVAVDQVLGFGHD